MKHAFRYLTLSVPTDTSGPVIVADRLGVEVTEPALAGTCGLGNIDPQHAGGSTERAAIDEALTWPLPSRGAQLATIRPDLDALGAMAILTMRAENITISAGVLERVRLISKVDRFDHGPWPGPRTAPETLDDWRAFAHGPEGLAAVASFVFDKSVDLASRVAWMQDWLMTGEPPQSYYNRLEARAYELQQAVRDQRLDVRASAAPGIALVTGSELGVLALGYRIAPVVIAAASANPVAEQKATIAQHDPTHADFTRLARELNLLEPGWGGSPTIIGSPLGSGTKLPLKRLVSITASTMLEKTK